MEIDIRTDKEEDVRSIRFYDVNPNKDVANRLAKGNAEGLFIEDTDSGDSVFIENKEHATNLIAAIQKAIDLGWFE